MRRQPILLAIGLLAVVGVSGVSGASTSNQTFTATIAEVHWDSYNPTTGVGQFGTVQFARENGETFAFYQRAVGEIELCAGGDTPDNPEDDFYGFVGREWFGFGPATLTVGKQFISARASATIEAEVASINECTGTFGTPAPRIIKVSTSLVGVSGLINETTRTILKAPSELTAHSQVRGTFREAAGTVTVNTLVIDVDAVIGELTFREHETTH